MGSGVAQKLNKKGCPTYKNNELGKKSMKKKRPKKKKTTKM
jgi:hypothetical protein